MEFLLFIVLFWYSSRNLHVLLVGILYSWLQLCRRLVESRNSCLGNSRRRTSLSPLFHYDIQRSFGDPSSKIMNKIFLFIIIHCFFESSYISNHIFFTIYFLATERIIFSKYSFSLIKIYTRNMEGKFILFYPFLLITFEFFFVNFNLLIYRLSLTKLLKILKSDSFEDKYL